MKNRPKAAYGEKMLKLISSIGFVIAVFAVFIDPNALHSIFFIVGCALLAWMAFKKLFVWFLHFIVWCAKD